MRKILWVSGLVLVGSILVGAQAPPAQPQSDPLAPLRAETARRAQLTLGPPPPPPNVAPAVRWAYYAADPNRPLPSPPEVLSVPGSSKTYPRADMFNQFHTMDWFPDEHAPMPSIVENGREGATMACSLCHNTSGMGHPASATLAGLPVSYMLRQLADLKSGARANHPMGRIAAQITDAEARAAVEWFAALKPKPWYRVVETTTVPASFQAGAYSVPATGGRTEPLGNRIVELPEDWGRAMVEDPRSGFVAYVPPGSVKRGEVLVTTGAEGKTVMCTLCHGPELRGLGEIPGIAGRAPSFIVRQLNGIQTGLRKGGMNELMRPVVEKLTPDDMLAIGAYVASRQP